MTTDTIYTGQHTATITSNHQTQNNTLSKVSNASLHLGLASVFAWIGAMKFTTYEAESIQGLVASNPLTSWLYEVTSLQGAANLLGVAELTIAVLLILGISNKKLSILGALGAIATLLVTLSFMLTVPSVWEASLGGFPALSVLPGQFLVKDLGLLGIAVALLANALQSVKK